MLNKDIQLDYSPQVIFEVESIALREGRINQSCQNGFCLANKILVRLLCRVHEGWKLKLN